MLNSYARAYNSLNISATSGTLIKAHPKSFMKSYQINSVFEKELNDVKPMIRVRGNLKECVVIQTMVVGNDWLMSEVVCLEDYLNGGEVND